MSAKPVSRLVAAVVAAALAVPPLPAQAQQRSGGGIPLIRDAEIEQLMRD